MPPIFDLHCDLLSYLAESPEYTPWDTRARCSIPQLQKGNVHTQVLAIFTESNSESVTLGNAQHQRYLTHQKNFAEENIQIPWAIENASSFSKENETFHKSLERLKTWISHSVKPLYISMTWKHENRFGGGNETSVGLKDDGLRLLHFMAEENISLDFSHTSDWLAEGLVEEIEKRSLPIPVIASHSNFRAVCDHPRNLPDALASFIIQRKGLIGINFVQSFVGQSPKDFLKHIEYGLKLNAENALCFGADFFYDGSISEADRAKHGDGLYFSECENAECYPQLLESFPRELQKKIAHENAEQFLTSLARSGGV